MMVLDVMVRYIDYSIGDLNSTVYLLILQMFWIPYKRGC